MWTLLSEPHPEAWTEEEFLALQDEGDYPGPRIELFDGCLLLNPWPTGRHQQVVTRLANLLEGAASPDVVAVHQINVRVAPSSIFVPDVVVLSQPDDLNLYDAKDVVLVAEVVTPYGGGQETLLKRAMYAEARIPRYVMVDGYHDGGEDLVATLDVLRDGAYAASGRARPGEVLRIDEPSLDLDPADLLRRE